MFDITHKGEVVHTGNDVVILEAFGWQALRSTRLAQTYAVREVQKEALKKDAGLLSPMFPGTIRRHRSNQSR
jgi:hypothetical protein